MIATITISRRDHRDEDRDLLVDVTRDRDGDIYATCGEDLDELRTTNRHGSIETHPTGRLFQRRGDSIELTDDELAEAEFALTQLETLWQAERTRLKQIFRPQDSEESNRLPHPSGCLDKAPIGRDASPRGPSNSSSATLPSCLETSPKNKSGSGTLKNAQARSNTSCSEATENLKSPPDAVNPSRSLPRHDLLNSQGQNITLPPGAPTTPTNNSPSGEGIIPSSNSPTGSLPHSEFRIPSSELAAAAAHE